MTRMTTYFFQERARYLYVPKNGSIQSEIFFLSLVIRVAFYNV